MLAAENGNGVFFKPCGEVFRKLFRRFFQQTHICSQGMEQAEGGTAAAACSDDGYTTTRDLKGRHGYSSAQFQDGKRDDGQKDGNDPETDDDLGFR